MTLSSTFTLLLSIPRCGGLNHFPGKTVPMLGNPFSEGIFPNNQSKPPLEQLEAISSHPKHNMDSDFLLRDPLLYHTLIARGSLH